MNSSLGSPIIHVIVFPNIHIICEVSYCVTVQRQACWVSHPGLLGSLSQSEISTIWGGVRLPSREYRSNQAEQAPTPPKDARGKPRSEREVESCEDTGRLRSKLPHIRLGPQEHLVSQHHIFLKIGAGLVDIESGRAVYDWIRPQ